MTDDQRLTERLAALVDDEPPFETDLGTALWAARLGGRRRRARTVLVRTATAALACAAVTAAALAMWWPAPPRALSPPAATTSRDSGVPAPATLGPAETEAAMRQLGSRIAAGLGGDATVTRTSDEPLTVTGRVRTAAGPVAFSIVKSPNREAVEQGRRSCRPGVTGPDDRVCQPLLVHATIGVWDLRYPPHRRVLQVDALTPDDFDLSVAIDNLLDEPSGRWSTGPDWQQAGLTVPALLAAIADSRLVVPDR